ncbi:MAG: lipocalin family protein [Phocaeicola sp.]
MKTFFKIMMFFSLLFTATACSNSDEPVIENMPIEATYANVAGTWELTSWNDAPLAEGLYCYLEFNRKDRTFVIYDNMNSMVAHKQTGSFTIAKDPKNEKIDLISGRYDYDGGKWSNVYQLVVFENQMNWTVQGDLSDVSIYERCNEIPAEVLNGTSRTIAASELKRFL